MVAENARGIKPLQPGDADVVAVQVRDQQVAGALGMGFRLKLAVDGLALGRIFRWRGPFSAVPSTLGLE